MWMEGWRLVLYNTSTRFIKVLCSQILCFKNELISGFDLAFLIPALVKVNVKLKPMLDSVAVNRSKWEELHQKRLQVSAASPPSASLMVTGEDRN
ncbi:hypothetical protein CB1_013966007 [Camelus ferus]|nr:hypothetical protein CB1_013966007 [Camelus ferus]